MAWTYPFAAFGQGSSMHYTCELRRSISDRIKIGDDVYIGPEAWLNVPEYLTNAPPALVIGSGCRIGRRCILSAKNLQSTWRKMFCLGHPC